MALLDNLETMLARGQDSALVRYGLGAEYLKLQQYELAIVHLRKALTHERAYSAAWKLLGQALALAGNQGDAAATYEEGIRVAEQKGDKQAAKEMRVFLRRLQK